MEYLLLFLLSLLVQYVLYKQENKTKKRNIIYLLNMVLVIIISRLLYSSLPSNHTLHRFTALFWGGLGILSMFIELLSRTKSKLSNILMSSRNWDGLIQLIFF